MKKLSKELKKYGNTLTQVRRNNFAAVYKITDSKTGKSYGFEVFKIKKQKAVSTVLGGVAVAFEAKEAYPSSEDWGSTAWTHGTLNEAEYKYQNITKRCMEKLLGIDLKIT